MEVLNGTHLQGKPMKIKIARKKGTLLLHEPEAEIEPQAIHYDQADANKEATNNDHDQYQSFEIIPEQQLKETEEEIEIEEEDEAMAIIDETHTYFNPELCIVHGGDNCFDTKETHPPTTSPASSSTSPFHGFNEVPYSEEYVKDDNIHERLQEFNNNALHIYSMEKVAIPPYCQ